MAKKSGPIVKSSPKVDALLAREKRWPREFAALRELVLACGLDETVKWGQACYTLGEANIVLIHGFKDYCALLFFKGALMQDPQGLLIQQTPNVQSGRQIRFHDLKAVTQRGTVLKAYVRAAIAVERAGLKVAKKETADYPVPEEFRAALDDSPALKAAFTALTPGRQRAYLYYFAQAKQSQTRLARIEKHRQRILDGQGLD